MVPHYTASFVELIVVIQTPPQWSQCYWFCFQCVSQLKHDLHITSGAGLLFNSNDQHNVLMWSSKLCLVRINRIFLHSALFFFLSPPHPFKSQLHFPPSNDTPQGSGWTATWKGATALPRNLLASAEECPFPGASLRQTVLCTQEQDWNPVTLNP